MTHYIGIDPGASGGVALYDGKTLSASKCPKKVGDMYALLEIYASRGDLRQTAVLIEKVWSFPSDSSKTAFAFGRNYGSWIAALEIIGLNYKLVTPKGWQKHFEVPKLQKKERKNWLKAYAQKQVDKTEMKFNVTLYTADAIMIALAVKDMWEGLDYVEL
tara:strand:+ start:19392 stop:19871 length:480 start_codon:yes stop_codon:yes gene_type:complete